MSTFDDLTSNFSRLPGIGKKSAVRIVNWLLNQDDLYNKKFANNLALLKEKVKPCSVCGTWTETDPCPVCSNPLRDKSVICVVEQPQDVSTIEAYGEFKGFYHVLGGLIKPLEGIGPSALSIQPLINRIKKDEVKEVIVALNPTVEGDTTSLYLNKIISEQISADSVKITRLATGIPVGGDLEYIDKRTLSLSFRGRHQI
ncbi:MAG: recombination mediator RecR [Treponema sp.]|nr:recombination mediator RecR [Spirochaetia bacterium]MDY5124495.1 recombination mediator RecR [Treponema sp.]